MGDAPANPVNERPFTTTHSINDRSHETKHLSKAEIAIVKARILRGDRYVDIASDYRLNQGRLADLKFGRIHADVEPANLDDRRS
ncbi:hypothetical protein CP49_36930 [Bradyrhizobium valentinum]|uniref:Uncharacterized protein n=1 Tax=Bradyrhizobium valentinum TaxID=1518501 RepID=A0A0R3KFJ4_9BRAD|nr:hypothetical protein CP49_36930 [Bradyrhizobium valentinum]